MRVPTFAASIWRVVAVFAAWITIVVTAVPAAKGFATNAGTISADNGVELFYRVDGSSADTVVVLHGGPGLSMAYLEPDLAPLAKAHTVIYYDQRGSGESTVISDSSALTVEAHVADLEALRAHFHLRAMKLLGHSWGAGLAAEYAARHPERVERMLLVDAMPSRVDPYGPQFGGNLRAWMDDSTKAKVAALSAARKQAADPVTACRDYWSLFIRGYFADPQHPPTGMRGDVCAMPAAALRNASTVSKWLFASLGEWDLRPMLSKLDIPTLVIHGERDPIPLASATEWAESLPQARLLVVPGSGHFPHVERPELFFPSAETVLAGRWPAAAR
ncbi:MAG: alpha/beta fold hydrolase [Candidatus Eisenbacteria bacterium]